MQTVMLIWPPADFKNGPCCAWRTGAEMCTTYTWPCGAGASNATMMMRSGGSLETPPTMLCRCSRCASPACLPMCHTLCVLLTAHGLSFVLCYLDRALQLQQPDGA